MINEFKVNNDSCFYVIGVTLIKDKKEYVWFYNDKSFIAEEMLDAHFYRKIEVCKNEINRIIDNGLLDEPMHKRRDGLNEAVNDVVKNLIIIKITANGSEFISTYDYANNSLYVIKAKYNSGYTLYVSNVTAEEKDDNNNGFLLDFEGCADLNHAKVYRSLKSAKTDAEFLNIAVQDPTEDIESVYIVKLKEADEIKYDVVASGTIKTGTILSNNMKPNNTSLEEEDK